MNINRIRIGYLMRHPLLLISLVIVLCHGLLILLDFRIADGWFFNFLFSQRNHKLLDEIMNSTGNRANLPFLQMIWQFSNFALATRLLSLILWMLMCLGVYGTIVRSGCCCPGESLCIALISGTYPLFTILGEYSIIQYIANLAFFYSGTWLYLIADDDGTKKSIKYLKLLALVLIAYGFGLNSMLALYYAFLLSIIVKQYIADNAKNIKVFEIIMLFVLPLCYWLWKQHWSSAYGFYKEINYNLIDLSRGLLFIDDFIKIIANVLIPSFNEVVCPFGFTVSGITLFIIIVGILWKKVDVDKHESSEAAYGCLICFGLVGCVTAVLPYVIVQKKISLDYWPSRNCLPLQVPVAILVVGLLKWICNVYPSLKRYKYYIVIWIITGSLIVHWNAYLELQGRTVQYYSVLEQIKKMQQFPYTLIEVHDELPQPHRYIAAPSWSYIFYEIDKNPVRYAYEYIDGVALYQTKIKSRDPIFMHGLKICGLDQVNLDGPRCALFIRQNDVHANLQGVALRYLAYKWLYPKQLERFMAQQVSLTIHPLE